MDNNAANGGAISVAANRVAVRVIRTDEELTIARAASHTLGLNIANEELHPQQTMKWIFRVVPFSARDPPIVKPTFQTRC